ncbi:unnamed protein product [Rotaria sordida]|uniref:NACHT domain-containing protein n=1 Tax=Rotaria sordida TaxID=392033 RepID=A0A814UZB4_9BILA|nr:unnamed protein product [Rotaria sordida]
MLTSVLNDKESDLVNEVYRLDENPLYPIYIILPVDTESEEWKETEKQLVNWLDKSDQDIYLTTFQENIFTAIKRQIDYHMAQVRPKDILYEEVLENAIQCQMLNKRHFPCENILTKVKSFVLSNTSQPCIIYGNSGTGKSSMMAHLILKIPYWFLDPNSVSVIIRFLGTTPLSSDIRRPLISIIHQICALYHIDLSLSLNDSMIVQELKQLLEQIFTKIPTNERLVLLFDSIDQLQTENYDCSIWLPVNYPQNIKCILSTIPVIVETHTTHNKKEYKIVEGLMSHFNDATFIEITKFDEHLAQQVFDSWLQHDHRRLTPLQMNWLKPKLKSYIPPDRSDDPEPTPLFLSLLYDITLTWYSFDNEAEDSFLSIKRTYDAIKYLYNQMSKKHGEVLFKRAMTYFVLAGGLTDIELEDILSADNIVLQSVFVHYLPPLNIFRLPSILWIRIRNDMQKYLVEKDVDNTSVIYFYHRSFEHYNPFSREIPNLEFIRRAYFAENIGNFPNLNDQPFEIKAKKLIKKNNGISLLVVNRCLTKQLPAIIKVTFRTGIIQYLWVGFWRENLNVPITIKFEFLATLEEKLGDQSIFLNKETDIYYCEGQSYLRFYYFQRPKRIQLKRIQNLPPLNRIVYRYEDWGIIVNCALENGQLRKYNATIMTYLPVKFATLQENSSLREQIDYFEIQNNFIVTFDQAKCDVNLFTYSNRLSFVMHLRVPNAISQFAINSSYLLVFDCKNRLSIYSICSTPILLFETTEFYNESIKIHSLASSFLIVDGDKQQIFQINTDHPLVLRTITHLKIQCHSLLSTVVPKRVKLFILSDDNSTLTIWDLNTRIIKYLPTLINKSTQINKIYSLSTTIVFHDNRQRIYLWYIDNGNQIITFDHDRLEKEGNCLTLIDPNGNKLFVVHDINKSLYGDIRLEISLDTFCLTEDGKYLFGISQKESLLFMYRIDDRKCLEKIFIDNLSPLLKVSNDCLILLRNNELLLISIIDQDASTLKR